MTAGTFGAPNYPYVPTPTAILLNDELSDGSVRLWMLLFQYAVTGSGNPFEMTVGEMMELTGASKMSVIKRKKELTDAGWLQETALRGLGRTNIYAVVTPGDHVPAPTDS